MDDTHLQRLPMFSKHTTHLNELPKDIRKYVKKFRDKNDSPDTKVFKYLLKLVLDNEGTEAESLRNDKAKEYLENAESAIEGFTDNYFRIYEKI